MCYCSRKERSIQRVMGPCPKDTGSSLKDHLLAKGNIKINYDGNECNTS